MKRVHLIISGAVQGVGYRAWVKRQAKELHLVGWVKNRPDQTVELIADGADEDLEELIARCKQGPEVSLVEVVVVTWGQATKEFFTFSVVY